MTYSPLATYFHRAKPYAQEARLSLWPEHLTLEQGGRSADFALRDIATVRLTYKPRNTTNEGYLAQLYGRGKGTVSFTNLVWKNMMDMERRDAEYRHFVALLIDRVHAANPDVALRAGLPGWLYGVSAVTGALVVGTLVFIAGDSVINRTWPVAMLACGMAFFFGWWTWRYITRNKPRLFAAGAIPEDVLPKA
jgi:hypothetical protein